MTTTTTTEHEESEVPHERYHKTNRSTYNSQKEVTDAWASGAFPVKNYNPEKGDKAVDLTCSANFYGRQQRDGSGQLYHYNTLEAIRTRNGLVINNRQCWSRGFAHCTPPRGDDRDASLPLDAIRDMIRKYEFSIYDIVRIRGDREQGKIVHFDSGEQVAVFVGRDSTARDSDVYLTLLEGVEITVKPYEVEETILKPDEVIESGYPVVGSDEYVRTRFRDPDQETIERENLVEVETYYGSKWHNKKFYRESMRGSVVVRHGEWFFVPAPEFEPGEMSKPSQPCSGDVLGNHEVVRQNSCWKVANTVYVCGTIKHRHGDHNAINLGDTWHKAVTHNRECRTVSFGSSGGGRID